MLSELYIENVAILSKVSVHFDAGFSVLTGETGAGKSILIDAVHLILGMRSSRDIIRSGEKSAKVAALFTEISPRTLDKLNGFGVEADDEGNVLLQRILSIDGKSSCRINGQPVTAAILRDVGAVLINIHGQHDHQALLSPETHVDYLDGYGKLERLVEEYKTAYAAYKTLKNEQSQTRMDESERARRVDLLAYQIEEIEAAGLEVGEQEELSGRRTQILNAEKIVSALAEAGRLFDGDEMYMGMDEAAGRVLSSLSSIADYSPEAGALFDRLEGLSYELAECGSEIHTLLDDMEFEPSELSDIEMRLDVIYRLSLKYGRDIEEILSYQARAKKELETLENTVQNRERLEKKLSKAKDLVEQIGHKLSEKRRETAAFFTEGIQYELRFLDMQNVRFEVEQKETDPTAKGFDVLQFLISTNAGEPPKPIAKIASGGELSRIMLALKNVLAQVDDMDTLIFDEIDAGISGQAAQKVGQKIKEVSAQRQVICVTHLAQIACHADAHFFIEKKSDEGKTFTTVRTLDYEGRKEELARIMGDAQSQTIRMGAEELLRTAGI